MTKLIHVAVGVIFDCSAQHRNNQSKILIAKRAQHQHQGGLWEFPGGKIEPGESPQVALQRELEEELGLHASIDDMQPLITIPFHYPDKSVLLDVWCVFNQADFKRHLGQEETGALGKEGQPLAWVVSSELWDPACSKYQFPAANKAILNALRLPQSIAISQDRHNPEQILAQVATTLKHNPDTWIMLRAPSLDQVQYTQLAMKLYGICHEAGSLLIWNCPLEWYQVAFADGLHLSVNNYLAAAFTNPALKNGLKPIPDRQWFSMPCHNEAELQQAQNIADYLLVSSIKDTASHVNSVALTWSGFEQLTQQARIPCYALGGLNTMDIPTAIKYGGQGIAGIRCFIEEKEKSL